MMPWVGGRSLYPEGLPVACSELIQAQTGRAIKVHRRDARSSLDCSPWLAAACLIKESASCGRRFRTPSLGALAATSLCHSMQS